MLSNLSFWWARRLGYKALILSLEQAPEAWDSISTNRAKKGNLTVLSEHSGDLFRNSEILIITKNGNFNAPFWKGKRIVKALARGAQYKLLREAMVELKPPQTPLQIEDARCVGKRPDKMCYCPRCK
jgi:hypothetical protein